MDLGAKRRLTAQCALMTTATAVLVAGVLPWPQLAAFARSLGHHLYLKAEWFISKSTENIIDNFLGILTAPITFGDRLHWINIAGFVAFAAVAAFLYERGKGPMGIRGFLRFLFPLQNYTHPSARIDYQVFLINRLFTPVRLATRVLSDTVVAALVLAVLTEWFGPRLDASLAGASGLAVYTLLLVLTVDFTAWVAHAVMHRVPVLWEFHKLHHSAEVLNPMVVYRVHPVEEIVNAILSVHTVGAASGVLAYLFMEEPHILTIFGVNAVIAVFYAAGHHLRHSHIWLSWGPLVSYIFISPAQHQIHHSVDPRHLDKNYGLILSVWDWMFGTLYVPKEREHLQFGLLESQPHPTVWAAYFHPFTSAWKILAKSPRGPTAIPTAIRERAECESASWRMRARLRWSTFSHRITRAWFLFGIRLPSEARPPQLRDSSARCNDR